MNKGSAGLACLLSFGMLAAWLNVSHIYQAVLSVQPGIPPHLTVEGIQLVPKGAYTPIIASIAGLLMSAGIAFCLAFRNLVVTDRPWLRFSFFVGLIGVVLACSWLLKLKLDFVNASNISDSEIAQIAENGFLSLKVVFERGDSPTTASFGLLLCVYTLLATVLAFPETRTNSSGHRVRSPLRR